MTTRTWNRSDAGTAIVLAIAIGALFSLMLQARLYGDAAIMVQAAPDGPSAGRHHVGYLLGRELLQWCWPGGHALSQARIFSAICCGLGGGFSFLFARGLGASRRSALFGVALVSSTPVVLFFGTTVEIHAWQYFMAALGACVTVASPWRKPLVAVPIAAFGLFLAFLGHEVSIFLGPGWVLLCAWLAARQGAGFSRARGFLVVGPAILALLVLYLWALYACLGGGTERAASSSLDMLNAWAGVSSVATLLKAGVLLPLLCAVPLFLVGLRSQKFEPLLRLALGTLALVPFLFLVWFRVPERGGYLMGVLPFMAPVAAVGVHAIVRYRRAVVAWVAIVLNAVVGLWSKSEFDSKLDPEEHVQLVREATGGSGLVLSAAGCVAPLAVDFPGIEQVFLGRRIRSAIRGGMTADEFAVQGLALVESLIAADPSVLERGLYLDNVQESPAYQGPMAVAWDYREVFEAALRTKFNFEQHERAEWRVSRLTAR